MRFKPACRGHGARVARLMPVSVTEGSYLRKPLLRRHPGRGPARCAQRLISATSTATWMSLSGPLSDTGRARREGGQGDRDRVAEGALAFPTRSRRAMMSRTAG